MKFPRKREISTNRINLNKESDEMNAGGAGMFFLFLYGNQKISSVLIIWGNGSLLYTDSYSKERS